MVEYLIAQERLEAHLEYHNSDGENVLHLASRFCNPRVFRILVEKFKQGVHQLDNHNNSVLTRVIAASISSPAQRCESARILLVKGMAGAEGAIDGNGLDPLRIAVRRGDVDMCRLLIDVGEVDPLPQP